jgi:type IV pilus assembly protein PilC
VVLTEIKKDCLMIRFLNFTGLKIWPRSPYTISRYRMEVWKMLKFSLAGDYPVSKALEKTDSKDLITKHRLNRLKALLKDGGSFADAASKVSGLFPKKYIEYIKQGEKNNALAEMFDKMEEKYMEDLKLAYKVKASSVYPIMLLIISAVCLHTLLVFVVPMFASMFQDLGVPFPERKEILETCIWILIAHFAFWYLYILLPNIRSLQEIYMKVPVFGKLFKNIYWTEFTKVLSSLLKSGAPVPESVAAAGNIVGGPRIKRECSIISTRCGEGMKLSEAMKKSGLPSGLVWAVSRGEITGNLEKAIEDLSKRYELIREIQTDKSMKLLEVGSEILLAVGIGSWILWIYSMILGLALPLI